MTTDLARVEPADVTIPDPADAQAALAHYLGTGDLSQLAPERRAALYLEVCRSLAINPRTRPLDWIEFYDPASKGRKLTLYPNKTCTDQLAYLHKIRVETIEEKVAGTLFKVAVKGTMPDGRTEENVAYVDLLDAQGQALRGQRLGDAYMKCHTKAKRRLVLGMVGMSVPDDDALPRSRRVVVDAGGNIIERPTEEQRYLAETPAAARAIGEPTFEDHAGVSTGLEDAAMTAPAEHAAPPAPKGPPPSFRPSEEDVKRWLGAWFAAVKDSSLDDDDARHRFVEQWTASYVPGLRTDSLRGFFERATPRQAGDLLAHVRASVDDEKRAQSSASDDDTDERPF